MDDSILHKLLTLSLLCESRQHQCNHHLFTMSSWEIPSLLLGDDVLMVEREEIDLQV